MDKIKLEADILAQKNEGVINLRKNIRAKTKAEERENLKQRLK